LGLNMKGTDFIVVFVLAVGALTLLVALLELASLWRLPRAAPMVEREVPSQTIVTVPTWNGLCPFCGQGFLLPGTRFCLYHGHRLTLAPV